MTFLSSMHPYPAMIANELATELARRYVRPGDSVLDPFCGTARTLLAAETAGAKELVGVDVNPLAALIATAKFSPVSIDRMRRLRRMLPSTRGGVFKFETRKVSWFSGRARRQLTALIRMVNAARWLRNSERVVIAAIVSATARHVSFCRNDQWKLHRLSPDARRRPVDAVAAFYRRLDAVTAELDAAAERSRARAWVLEGSCVELELALTPADVPKLFDVVITSPPYGDSISTVQYGGISSICLDVIRHLKGVRSLPIHGRDIDARCLGAAAQTEPLADELRNYWAGGVSNARRTKVVGFLSDMRRACSQIARVVKPGGRVIFVVGRRHTGGFRLKLDRFVTDAFESEGFSLETAWERPIRSKKLPSIINRLGGAPKGAVATMRAEYIVVLRRPENVHTAAS